MLKYDAYFEKDELALLSRILRGVYTIRTANGEDDKFIGEFIAALENGCKICCKEEE